MVLDYESTLSPEMLRKAYDELGEDEQRRADSVMAIRDWVQKQPHLQAMPTDTQFLLNFLRRCKYSIEETKHTVDTILTLRNKLPEFSGWNPMSPDIQAALSAGLTLPLPGHDYLGRKVYLFRAACYDPAKISQENLNRTSLMITEIFMSKEEEVHLTGVVIIFDFTDFTLKHLIHMDFAAEKRLSPIWNNFLQPKVIHYINTPSVFNIFMRGFVNPFLKEETKQKNKVHGHDRESLFKEIPKDVIPKDFGGDGMSCAELTVTWKRKCEDECDFLKEREKIKADESKRPHPSDAEKKTEGSFRKLCSR